MPIDLKYSSCCETTKKAAAREKPKAIGKWLLPLVVIFLLLDFAINYVLLKTEGSQGNLSSYLSVPMNIFILLIGTAIFVLLYLRMAMLSRSMARQVKEYSRLAYAIEQTAESIIISDSEGQICYANAATNKICGYSKDDLVGNHISILQSSGQDSREYMKMWQRVQKGERCKGTIAGQDKQGNQFEREITISPVCGKNCEIVDIICITRDLTKESQLEKQLRHAQKMEAIGTLAGGVAHDFNNILFAVLGYTDLALEEMKDSPNAVEFLNEVRNATLRACDLVKQILTFSRQSEQEHKPIQLQPVIKETLKLLAGSLPSSIKVDQEISQTCPSVMTDPTQIHQVLMNLCTNAYHAMKENGGVLRVQLQPVTLDKKQTIKYPSLIPGHYVKLTVRDTGKGMDELTRQRIFDPYFTTKAVGEGTGLGLAVVHGIMKKHNGAISVESEPGHGSKFEVFFPAHEEIIAETDIEPVTNVVKHGKGNVLVVDDEEMIVTLETKILEGLGYNVHSYNCSVEALEAFMGEPDWPDIVLTDQTMPYQTGEEMAATMTKIRPSLPIIICTGYNNIQDPERAKKYGISHYIQKPISPAELGNVVHMAINEPQPVG